MTGSARSGAVVEDREKRLRWVVSMGGQGDGESGLSRNVQGVERGGGGRFAGCPRCWIGNSSIRRWEWPLSLRIWQQTARALGRRWWVTAGLLGNPGSAIWMARASMFGRCFVVQLCRVMQVVQMGSGSWLAARSQTAKPPIPSSASLPTPTRKARVPLGLGPRPRHPIEPPPPRRHVRRQSSQQCRPDMPSPAA